MTRSSLKHRQHYIVTIEEDETSLAYFRNMGLVPISTDATFFMHAVKDKLQQDDTFVPDEVYDAIRELLDITESAHARVHRKYNILDDPEIILCASYQDGMIHACERILNLRVTGKYSDRNYAHSVVHGYLGWRAKKLHAKKFADVAYIDGYLNVMTFVMLFGDEDLSLPPSYFLFARSPLVFESFEDFERGLKRLRAKKEHHVGAYREAVAATKGMDEKSARKIIISHKCQLL